MQMGSVHTQAINIHASGGVLIGLLLAMVVIFGGFSLILGTEVEIDNGSYPAWVDQRFTSASPYQAVPASTRSSDPIVVAEVGR